MGEHFKYSSQFLLVNLADLFHQDHPTIGKPRPNKTTPSHHHRRRYFFQKPYIQPIYYNPENENITKKKKSKLEPLRKKRKRKEKYGSYYFGMSSSFGRWSTATTRRTRIGKPVLLHYPTALNPRRCLSYVKYHIFLHANSLPTTAHNRLINAQCLPVPVVGASVLRPPAEVVPLIPLRQRLAWKKTHKKTSHRT